MSIESQTETRQAPGQEHADTPVAEDELDQSLAQLRDDVSSGHVTEARVAVQQIAARWPESERVQYWVRVLAPPEVVPTSGPDPRSQPRDRERAWLREHGREYPGYWLAVYEDRLIAAGP